MTRRDHAVVAVLVLLLAVLGGAIALPPPAPSSTDTQPTPGPSPIEPVTYREGVIGVPESITPLTAHSRSERTIVGLVFSGLVRLGAGQPPRAGPRCVVDHGRHRAHLDVPDPGRCRLAGRGAGDIGRCRLHRGGPQEPRRRRPGRRVVGRGGRGCRGRQDRPVHPRIADRKLPRCGDHAPPAGAPAGRRPVCRSGDELVREAARGHRSICAQLAGRDLGSPDARRPARHAGIG